MLKELPISEHGPTTTTTATAATRPAPAVSAVHRRRGESLPHRVREVLAAHAGAQRGGARQQRWVIE